MSDRLLGFRRLAILGTHIVTEGSVYGDTLSDHGIEQVIPAAEDRARLQKIILTELIDGQATDESKMLLRDVIGRMKTQGCDGVILGCTELPLVVSQEQSALPLLDSTRLLAQAAVQFATRFRPLPGNSQRCESAPRAAADR